MRPIFFMRTSFQSLSDSSKRGAQGGFSLVELLISLAIITVITAMVIVRFTAFDSNVLLKSLAYEVAATVRDAQVYSVSVARNAALGGDAYSTTYGVTFSSGASTYTFFGYSDKDIRNMSNSYAIPEYGAVVGGTALTHDILTYTMGGKMRIKEICTTTGGTETCGATRVDVSFRRPEYKALVNRVPVLSTPNEDIESVKIKLDSPNGANVWMVEVSRLGQITVSKN